MISPNFYFIILSTIVIYPCVAGNPYSPDEKIPCEKAIRKKFNGHRFRFEICQYAIEHYTISNFPESEPRYAREYYEMFREYAFAKHINSPATYCGSLPETAKNICNEQLSKFGEDKPTVVINALYNINCHTVDGEKYAKKYLYDIIKNIEIKQEAPNPEDFCANKLNTDKKNDNDYDHIGWEEYNN